MIGLQDFEIINYLLSEIERLKAIPEDTHADIDVNDFVIDIEQKKRKRETETLSVINKANENVPNEYLCPITKQIMKDPVIAFDGYCYERSAIETYLKLHNKSPITGDEAQYIIVFPNHRLKAEIVKYIEENVVVESKKDFEVQAWQIMAIEVNRTFE